MRRFSLNLTIALLAFTIGTTVSVLLYQHISQSTNAADTVEGTSSGQTKQVINQPNQSQVGETLCEDETTRLVLNTLKNEGLGTDDEMKGNCTGYIYVQQITDLNNDGEKDLLVSRKDSCLDGSCVNFWILQRIAGGGFKVLIKETATSANILKVRSKGYLDVKTGNRSSNSESTAYKLHKYNGKEYTVVKCWEEIDSVKNGRKTSKIVPLHCC